LSFTDFNLDPALLKAVALAGYDTATPIQAAAIPRALAGVDLLASAQTGTGKTAAFVLPMLDRLAKTQRTVPGSVGPRALVLAPTRELAGQIVDAIRKYGKFMRIHTVAILGGMPYRLQLQMLQRPVDVIVATPGRLIDHLERRRVDLSDCRLLVLDECDRMLDMGFSEDVDKIVAACPADRQTLLFTATLDKRMAAVAQRLLKDPERIAMAAETVSADNIEQRLHQADDLSHKHRLLAHLAADNAISKAIIFAATKRDADRLADLLKTQGHQAAALHGDMTQSARNWTLTKMRSGRIRLLVATDVAARGIDVKDISHVINFDLPRFAEDYVHRIGRTGRAGATGIAISFASPADRPHLERIERFIGRSLSPEVIPGLEPVLSFNAPQRRARPRRFAGKPTGGAPRNRDERPRQWEDRRPRRAS
jgi:superfamily II DNA/RNA helicase